MRTIGLIIISLLLRILQTIQSRYLRGIRIGRRSGCYCRPCRNITMSIISIVIRVRSSAYIRHRRFLTFIVRVFSIRTEFPDIKRRFISITRRAVTCIGSTTAFHPCFCSFRHREIFLISHVQSPSYSSDINTIPGIASIRKQTNFRSYTVDSNFLRV